jgi:hypothetical protein
MEACALPRTPAAHVTQAAVLAFAVPLARRMQSEAFKALNRGDARAETAEAVGERFAAFLAARPLLSLREDLEDFFPRAPAPALGGLRECEGLRRWLVQRLAAPGSPERRALVVRKVVETWEPFEPTLREVLHLMEPSEPPPAVLREFTVLFPRGAWPEDLAPALRRQALALREKPHDDETAV